MLSVWKPRHHGNSDACFWLEVCFIAANYANAINKVVKIPELIQCSLRSVHPYFPFGGIEDLKRHSTSYIRHLSHRSMNEPEKHYKTFGIIDHICDKQTKRWVGRVDIVSVSVNNHVVCFRHKLQRITQ